MRGDAGSRHRKVITAPLGTVEHASTGQPPSRRRGHVNWQRGRLYAAATPSRCRFVPLALAVLPVIA
jgi:hypothetical protein